MFKQLTSSAMIATALKKGAPESPTSLTIDYTGATEDTIRALADAQVKVRVQAKFRKDQKVPGTHTVKVAEMVVGRSGMSADQIEAIAIENARADPKKAAELLKILQAAIAGSAKK